MKPDRAALAVMRGARAPDVHKVNPILCLKRSQGTGFPWHPLYVAYDTVPVPYGEAP